jgi:hypothetical protein
VAVVTVEEAVDEKLKRYHIENEQDWKGESVRIPWMYFRSDWQVRVIPPFGDAVVRFQVILPSGTLKSIYMDSRNSLGYWGGDINTPEPYWEVYPYKGDVGRCDLADTIMLMEMIQDDTNGEDDEQGATDKGTGGDGAEAGTG